MNPFASETVLTTCQLLIAVIFGAAAIAKLTGRARPSLTIRAAGLPAPAVIDPIIGLLEFGLAAAVIGLGSALVFAAAAVAVAVMSATLAYARLRGYTADCGCFGANDKNWPPLEVGRSMLMFATAVTGALLADGRWLFGHSPAAMIAAGIVITCVLVIYGLAAHARVVVRVRASSGGVLR